MYIYGQLLKAQLENSAADLTPASTGLVYFNTSTAFIKYYNGSGWKTVVDTDSTQTIINKVLGTVNTADLTVLVQDTNLFIYDSTGTNRAIRFDSVMPADNTIVRYSASQAITSGITNPLEIVDTTTIQTVLEKRTPIVRGSSVASGTLELRSTEHATKGYVHVTDGSRVLLGESDFASLMSSVGAGTPVFAFDQVGNGNLVLTADNSGTCFMPCWNSAGTYAAPTSVLSGDDLFQIAVRSFATTTGQNFVTGQKAVSTIGVYAAENHSTTTLGTGFFISASLIGATPRRRRIELDGTGQILLGDATAPLTGVNLKWVVDGAGDVGALSASRPNSIYAKAAVVATSQGIVQFYDSTNTNYMAFKAPAAVTTSRTFTLPDGDGTAGQILTTNGAQVLSWTTASGTGDVKGFASSAWVNADGPTKSINHALNSTDVDVTIIDLSDNQIIGIDTITVTDANNIALVASEAPATTWRVVVQAKP